MTAKPAATFDDALTALAAGFPDGLDPRDAAWMRRRLLACLGWAHRARLVHGAVFPEHVLIHPRTGWYSSTGATPPPPAPTYPSSSTATATAIRPRSTNADRPPPPPTSTSPRSACAS
jgi:hypothetical protein